MSAPGAPKTDSPSASGGVLDPSATTPNDESHDASSTRGERSLKRFAADASATITTGIGGQASGIGPALRGHIVASRWLSLHVGGSIGFGSIDAASATMTTMRFTTGARWRWLRVGSVDFDLGVDALLVHHDVHRTAPVADRARWLPGAHADLGVAWRGLSNLDIFATAGVDAAFGHTPIDVAGRAVAQVPPFRGVFELGGRLHF